MYGKLVDVEQLRSSWTLVKLTTNMRNSKNIVEWAHKQREVFGDVINTINEPDEPICLSTPGPEPIFIVTATVDKIYTDGVLKAVELIRERQETKFVILTPTNFDQVTNIVKESGIQGHRGPTGFNEEDSGCWIMKRFDFDGMESRSVIVLDTVTDNYGMYINANHLMRCTTNLVTVMDKESYERLPQGYFENCKVIEI